LQPSELRGEHRGEPPRLPAGQPAADPSSADQSLAEMAQRLEAALRKPKAVDTRAPMAPAPEHEEEVEEAAAAPPPPPQPSRPARSAEAKPARAEPKVKEGKALYDSLEQEMASLLGRPASKN
jgi:flagellar protein FliO/FliZ